MGLVSQNMELSFQMFFASIAERVEKLDANYASSNLVSIGRYVMTPDIFDTLGDLNARSGGEIQLADTINIHAQKVSVDIVQLSGRRFNCGLVDGFLEAMIYEANTQGVTIL